MTTPVLIMAVPFSQQRVRNVRDLLDAVKPGDVDVVWDVEHDAYDTFLRLMDRAGDGPCIFLEDDIALTTDWRPKIEAEIAAHGDYLIQCFTNRKDDVTIGSRWEPGSAFLNLQCYYMPAGMPPAVAEYGRTWDRANDPTGTDLMLANFLTSREYRYRVVCPSLVQHQPWTSAINPRRPKRRQSRTFVP